MQQGFGPLRPTLHSHLEAEWAEYNDQHHDRFQFRSAPEIKMYTNAVYYPNWRVYKGQLPSHLNFGMISHVFYAFASLQSDGRVTLSDSYADNEIELDGIRGCLRSFAALKSRPDNRHLKVILSVGGGAGSQEFAAVANDPQKRYTFATSARGLLDEYGLDGIDIDWEHPADLQQGADFISMLHDIRRALPQPQYVLTAALPAGEWALQNINLAHASTYLDLVNIMTYDFYGAWTKESGHQAQLFAHPEAHSCDRGITYMLEHGVPAAKLVMGIPVYGRSFLGCTQAGHHWTGLGGEEGSFEYKDLPRPGAEEKVDMNQCAAWCEGGDGGFVTYDNPETVQAKARYARGRGLAGLFYWTATGDAEGNRSLVYAGYASLHDSY